MATERWKHEPCGQLMTPGEMNRHSGNCPRQAKDFTSRMRFTGAGTGYTRVDESPSSQMTPGTRVQFEHQGQIHHGTIWAEAPHMTTGGGKKTAMRHVIPDGWRDTVPLPLSTLTKVEGAKEASRNGQFHTAALPAMPGEAEYGERHNRQRAKAAGVYPKLA